MQLPWNIRAVILLSALWFMTPPLYGQWVNDEPWWEYEDETPQIPLDVRLKMHALSQAYHLAGDYHNEKFKPEFHRREPENVLFWSRWNSLRARWIGFNDYLERFERSVWTNASSVTVGAKVVNFEHSQLHGTTLSVLSGVVDAARDLTPYLWDDIVRSRWEIFIARLTTLEDTLKDFD